MAPSTKRGATGYRYYVSRASLTQNGQPGSLNRIAAGVLEQFLAGRLGPMLATAWEAHAEPMQRLITAVRRVTLSDSQIVVQAQKAAVMPHLLNGDDVEDIGDGLVKMRIEFHMRRRQGALILEPVSSAATPAAKVDRALVRALVLARTWAAQLESGEVESVKALARKNGLCHNYAAKLLPLAYLAPDLSEAILKGEQPRAVSLSALTAVPLPASWDEQRQRFGLIGG